MPDVFLKRESDAELRFEHSILSGWIFAAIGCAAIYFGSHYIDPPVARWMITGMGVLFAALGVGGALWRYELTLDLIARTYLRRRGFWPSPRSLQGSLNELNGVLLTRTWRRGENSESAVWVVSLDFQGWKKPVRVFETTSERKGYRRLEQLARRLQTSAIDRTGDREVIRQDGEALVITLLAFGHHYRTRRLPVREIEDISIRPSKSSRSRTTRRHSGSERTEVVLRTDDIVVRVAGDLRDGSQQWLCSALLTLAGR